MAKAQSAVEFLTTYSWAFLVLGLFVVAILSVVSLPSKSTPTYLPQSCYISPSFPCSQALLLTNSTATNFMLIFQNNVGTTLYFPPNSLLFVPSFYTNTTYKGRCIPQNALVGSSITCNATLPGYSISAGTQVNPKFTLSYQICTSKCTAQVYNTSGTAVAVVSPYKSFVYTVQLLTSPTNGHIALNGVQYANGANVVFVLGSTYSVYALPPSSNTFYSWTASANVMLSGSTQSATANAVGPGTLTATFH